MTLGEVCTFNRGSSITSKEAVAGSIPVISGGKKPAFYHNRSNREAGTITVAGSGAYAGHVSFWKEPIFCADSFTVDVKLQDAVLPKYVYHYLKANQETIYCKKRGAGIPHVHGADLSNMKIPIPHIAEQLRIVDILDNFEALCNDMSIGIPAEIELRKKQYEHYQNKLLSEVSQIGRL